MQPGSDDMAGRQEYTAAKQQQRGAGIPVIAGVPASSGSDGMAALLSGGIDGVSVPLSSLPQLVSAAGADSSGNQEDGVRSILGMAHSPPSSTWLWFSHGRPICRAHNDEYT